jgi:hypothetical protein
VARVNPGEHQENLMRVWIAIALLFTGCATAHQPALSASRGALAAPATSACLNVTFDCPGGACNVTVNNPAIDAGVPVADASAPVDATVLDAAVVDAAPAVDASKPVDASTVDATAKDAAVVDASPAPAPDASAPPSGVVARPAASKGVGFYVVGSKLYDANGVEFRIRGTSKTHQDNQSPGLGKTKSNATRWLVYFVDQPDRTVGDMQSPSIGGTTAQKMISIPGFWEGTCASDSTSFDTMVNRWVRDAAKYQTIERTTILNVANEWGNDEIAWRDAYVAAIPKIRAAGWHGAVLVDAPQCGQNGLAIAHYGANILAADPEKNVIFDWHIYGNVFDSAGGIPRQWKEQVDLIPTMQAIQASGVAAIVGELGPGRNIGPSPTMMTPQRVIDAAESYGMGWLSWSWDDNDLANGMSDDKGFSHSYNGDYASPSDLTTFGAIIVDYWSRLAKPATVFQ